MRARLLIALFLASPGLVQASFTGADKGTSAAAFLKLGAGARAESMGEAGATIAADATAMYWNPASLVSVPGQSAVFMHAPYINPSYYDFGAFASRGEDVAWGVSWQHFVYGGLSETTPEGVRVGSFAPSDTAVTLAVASRLESVPGLYGAAMGVSVKYIRSKIINTAQALAMDAGLLLPPQADGRWRGAVVLTNFGTRLKYEEANEPLPLAIRLGQSFAFTPRWTGALDVILPRDNGPYTAAGVERRIPLNERWVFFGRAGVNSRSDAGGLSRLTFGTGLAFEDLSFDYAFMPMGGLGTTHRLSVGFAWGAADTPNVLQRGNAPADYQDLPYLMDSR